jgi:hypothetical protein
LCCAGCVHCDKGAQRKSSGFDAQKLAALDGNAPINKGGTPPANAWSQEAAGRAQSSD